MSAAPTRKEFFGLLWAFEEAVVIACKEDSTNAQTAHADEMRDRIFSFVDGLMDCAIIKRDPEKWLPVWWTNPWGKRIKAVAGNPSRTGKTVRIRAWYPGGMVERKVAPKNLEPRG